MWISAAVVLVVLAGVVVWDLIQRKHAILRNFPILGHFRYLFESVGPELRQYIVTNNNEERPFSRDERSWVYASSKGENNYRGFGTDDELELSPNYLIIKHSAFPLSSPVESDANYDPSHRIPGAKVLGGRRGRARRFRPESAVNISGMSFGSLSGHAVEAMNRGAAIAGCLHNTGEGGVTGYHCNGGELIWQIGTGYFGCRDPQGRFSMERFSETVASAPVRAIEVKLSQGAKPGMGGVLPGAKVTPEIAEVRGIPVGQTCVSPARHTAFDSVDAMLDFVEMLAAASGLPVGIKSAVGESQFWKELARLSANTGRGVDFVTIDGGEGGTGAGPMVFNDHVALPFKQAFSRVYREFAEAGIQNDVVFIGSGKLGFPESAVLAFALGCDMIAVGREAMLAVGCIQAQRCHTGHCPTGVATQNKWLVRGLDPGLKSVRVAKYIVTLRKEVLALSRACGVVHPAFLTGDHIEILDGHFGAKPLFDIFEYQPGWGVPSAADLEDVSRRMNPPGLPDTGLRAGHGVHDDPLVAKPKSRYPPTRGTPAI
jgi:glutamate synthase domain-containing protein 2